MEVNVSGPDFFISLPVPSIENIFFCRILLNWNFSHNRGGGFVARAVESYPRDHGLIPFEKLKGKVSA